jgi:hypothetical protein|nr:MAG TPA: hypothetical protein [Caudoviricetes sp.]
MFFSGCICDKCGASIYWKTGNRPPLNKGELTRYVREDGWSVGKDKILCDKCRGVKSYGRNEKNNRV